MEIKRSKDGLISKYTHADGSETIIKNTKSCGNVINEDGKVEVVGIERNKYSLFVSTSVGCPIKCSFCALSSDKYVYKKLTNTQIVDNVGHALKAEFEHNRSIRKKYVKLSYMGMGDALLLPPRNLRCLTKGILQLICTDYPFAKGIDGVDISTVIPKKYKGWPFHLGLLSEEVYNRYRINPETVNRSQVRIFYSLHNRFGDLTDLLKYYAVLSGDIKILKTLNYNYGIDIIIHHMFLDEVNDNTHSVIQLINVLNGFLPFAQLRILRYNNFPGSEFKNSSRFDELLELCFQKHTNVKYQVSLGSEIGASCGTFSD